MKIVVSGGEKTDNIVDRLSEKFFENGDQIVSLKFIDDLEEYMDCGYHIDRFIITEQSITKDGDTNSESEIRGIINYISGKIAAKNGKHEVVFLTQYNDMADIIMEESMDIAASRAIVLKEPPYTVQFFSDILGTEIDKLPGEYIYRPEDYEDEDTTIEEQNDNTAWEDDITNEEWEDVTDDDQLEYLETDDQFIDNNESNEAELADDKVDTTNTEWEDSIDDESNTVDVNDWEGDLDELTGTTAANIESEREDIIKDETDCDIGEESASVWTDEDIEQAKGIIDINEHRSSDDVHDTCDWIENSLERFVDEEVDEIYEDNKSTSSKTNENTEINGSVVLDDCADYNEVLYDNDESDGIDDRIYKDEQYESNRRNIVGRNKRKMSAVIGKNTDKHDIRDALDPFANRGNSIVVTGGSGSGISTVALNIANTLVTIGYTVLLVDMDTMNREQSYMSKLNYNAIEEGESPLMSAINGGNSIEASAKIVKPGLRLLSMWMGGDCVPIESIIKKDRIPRFLSMIKGKYNFVVYDMPFNLATGYLSDITYAADNIVYTVDCSNWGISKMMLEICNIDDTAMQESIFNRTEVIFNKYKGIKSIFGKKVSDFKGILKAMDDKTMELVGEDIGLYFEDMNISGVIDYDISMDDHWFSALQYSDTEKGFDIFEKIIENVVLAL